MMPKKNLTARFVESVSVEERTDFWDNLVKGLVLRVSPTGVKSWTVVYVRSDDSKKRRLTLGKFPAVSLEKARSKALAVMSVVSEGDDPAGNKRARREAMTFEQLGALFIEKYAKPNKKTWREDERNLMVDVYPFIGKYKAFSVKKRDILDILDDKLEAGSPAQSNNILATVRKMFNWAVAEDYLETSPIVGVKPKGKKVSRDRVLSPDEIKTIWNKLPEASISAITIDVIRLLFLTGQRSGEVSGMQSSEINLENATWTIPGSRTKNGLTHVVPLSSDALAIVQAAMDRTDPDELDVPLFTKIGEPIQNNAIAQAVRLKVQVNDDRWTPHDIRRTVATGMAEIGVMPHIIEATLNHISGFRAGVAGVYNRATYEPEKRRALDMWAEKLSAIVSEKPSKIRQLRAAT